MPLYVLFLCVTLYKIKLQNVCVGVWWLATAVLRWCGGAGPGRAAGRAGWWLHCRGGLYKLLPGHLYPPWLSSLIVSTDQSPAPTPRFDHIDQHHLSNRKTIKYNVPTKTILHNHFINLPDMISLLSSVVPEIYFAGYGSSPVSTSTHWDASWERISVLARGPSNTPDSR